MKTLIVFCSLFLFSFNLYAGDINKVWDKNEINRIADDFIFNSLKINNPIIADENNDGIFDILNIEESGEIRGYINSGTNEAPVFDKSQYKTFQTELSSIVKSMPMPVFFADNDGDKDVDMFAINDVKYNSETKQFDKQILELENTMDLDHYTLITIALVLIIVILIIAIAK
ncbi:MAG TPA: hypothetical protein VHP32_03855 [Ignavibacteria bacterium]|nr:hypothetical protein [Ignavibacteria bacterium]